MTPETSNPNSIPTLLRELRDETTTLLRQEVALAKTELKENAPDLQKHAMQIAIGGFIAYAGLILLLFGLAVLVDGALVRGGLDPDVARWAGYGIVGLLAAVSGWIMLSRSKRAMA